MHKETTPTMRQMQEFYEQIKGDRITCTRFQHFLDHPERVEDPEDLWLSINYDLALDQAKQEFMLDFCDVEIQDLQEERPGLPVSKHIIIMYYGWDELTLDEIATDMRKRHIRPATWRETLTVAAKITRTKIVAGEDLPPFMGLGTSRQVNHGEDESTAFTEYFAAGADAGSYAKNKFGCWWSSDPVVSLWRFVGVK